MPPINILPQQLEEVQNLLRRFVPDREVWAFGSRVGGQAQPHSDLDLVILGEDPIGLDVWADLREALAESELPWKVDVVDWAVASENFRRIIEAHHVVVQKRA